jgi:peptidoglycan hydrolase CwlO-like protein
MYETINVIILSRQEKRIYDLKKKNQELEKFKFVLDYKITELKKQIERENDIKNMKEQIQEMESELERFHKQNTQLELNITELRQKLKATDKEMHQERQKVSGSRSRSPGEAEGEWVTVMDMS